MGLFDTVVSEYPLPKVIIEGKKYPTPDQDFQTKDLECMMQVYKLTKDGRLSLYDKLIKYHGYISIYNSLHLESVYWMEYNLKFTDGYLVAVEPHVKILRD